ncbi:MAG: 3-hydroxyacyl-ACP dehydratase FabZ [Pseudomonadota bacterium]|nr:3-hydroxyacyl-ACP dehydratase FabZ [Pseudomonadota bacterium]
MRDIHIKAHAKPRIVKEVDFKRILEILPHRYPMLLIDKVIDITPGISGTGIKNVTANEPYFAGHFPKEPILPGVMMIESMAQTACVVVIEELGTHSEGRSVYFMSVEHGRFRKPVVPGDTIYLSVSVKRRRGNVWKFCGEAHVNGVLCAEAVFTAMIQDD